MIGCHSLTQARQKRSVQTKRVGDVSATEFVCCIWGFVQTIRSDVSLTTPWCGSTVRLVFQSRDICACCLVTNGDRCGGRWNHGNHFRGKVQRDWQPGASQTEQGGRRVLFLAFDPFFFLFFFSEREADHAEVAELWSIGGEGVEEMGEFLYFLHLEGDKETRKLQTLWEMRINV